MSREPYIVSLVKLRFSVKILVFRETKKFRELKGFIFLNTRIP